MTYKRLVDKLMSLGLSLPKYGSGPNGKIMNRDVEDVIANYYAEERILQQGGKGFEMRMLLKEVQLAARYDSLSEMEQEELFQDNNRWIMEEKYDGCRVVLCYHPEEGFTAWGRNRSVETMLPIEYTSKILVQNRPTFPGESHHEFLPDYKGLFSEPFILDCEVLCDGIVENRDGSFSGSKLNAAVSLLSQNAKDSIAAQRSGAPLRIVMFDYLPVTQIVEPLESTLWLDTRFSFEYRSAQLNKLMPLLPFERAKQWTMNKRLVYSELINNGGEGVIFKEKDAHYYKGISGRRSKQVCVKMKRSLGAFNDIDAFIGGYTRGTEWDEKGLIAGLKLHVFLTEHSGETCEYWIATVSGMPLELREKLSFIDINGNPCLKADYVGKVVTVDGQDISGRNRRIAHAVVDWNRGFREDKNMEDCILNESFIDSQIF